MSYRPDYLRLSKFYRYIHRVFDFAKTVNAMTDSRKNPSVPIAVIFTSMFLCEFTNDEASYGSVALG